MKYRPEVDGLRTLAIVPVVIYHLKIPTGAGYFLPGGFLGVDIFFVISGYLITSVLLREQAETGTLSILRFYQRRARRILPALLLVILATLAAGWFVMLPSELETLAYSTVAALAFVSNFFWFIELGEYGAQSGLLQPMLHTWSLAIEEQFYLVFPLLLLLLKPVTRPRVALWLLIFLLLVSLVLAQITTIEDKQLSFFSPVSRTWELLFGAVLALITFRRPQALRMGPRLGWLFPKLALLTLIMSTMLINLAAVNHPGLATLPVVLATGALICCSDPKESVARFLSWAPVVFIGKLSYSIYLWHFPVFAIGRLHNEAPPDSLTMAVWVTATLALSISGYYLVERPFRFKLSGRQFSATVGASLAVLAAFVLVIAMTDLSSRGRLADLAVVYGDNEIDNEVLRLRSWQWLDDLAGPAEKISKDNANGPSMHERERLWFASDEDINLLIIGNSHSKDLFNALHSSSDVLRDVGVSRFGLASDFPAEQLELLYASPNFEAADWILISTRYERSFETQLPDLIKQLKERGKRVALVGNTPEFEWPGTLPIFDWFVRRYGQDLRLEEMNSIAWNARSIRIVEMNQQLRRIARAADVTYLSREDLVCNRFEKTCALVTPDGSKTMYDYGHWTLEGASYFGVRAGELGWLNSLADDSIK